MWSFIQVLVGLFIPQELKTERFEKNLVGTAGPFRHPASARTVLSAPDLSAWATAKTRFCNDTPFLQRQPLASSFLDILPYQIPCLCGFPALMRSLETPVRILSPAVHSRCRLLP